MERSPHLTIELVWEDNDIEELFISADNGIYSGSASVYFKQGDVGVLANSIRGFPNATSHRELFSGGREDHYLSFAELLFHGVGGVGHPAVNVTLSEPMFHETRPMTKSRVELEVRFEPSALVEFCNELDAVAHRKSKRAVLRGIAALDANGGA